MLTLSYVVTSFNGWSPWTRSRFIDREIFIEYFTTYCWAVCRMYLATFFVRLFCRLSQDSVQLSKSINLVSHEYQRNVLTTIRSNSL